MEIVNDKEIPRGIDVTEDEMELLNNYRLLTSIDKGRVLGRIETLLESDTYKQRYRFIGKLL